MLDTSAMSLRVDIRRGAEAFLHSHGFDGTAVVNLSVLLERAIGLDYAANLQASPTLPATAFDERRDCVHVTSWKRYQLAVVLGHTVLEHSPTPSVETDADAKYFAAHVLVPRRALARARVAFHDEMAALGIFFLSPIHVIAMRMDEDRDAFVPLRGGATPCDESPKGYVKSANDSIARLVAWKKRGGTVIS